MAFAKVFSRTKGRAVMHSFKGILKLIVVTSFIFSIGCNEFEVTHTTEGQGLSLPDDSDSSSSGHTADSNDSKPPAQAGDPEAEALSKSVQTLDADYQKVSADITEIETELDEMSLIQVLDQVQTKSEAPANSKVSLSFGLADKLKEKLDLVTANLKLMAGKIDELEARLLDKIATVDPLVQILLYEQLQTLLQKVEFMKSKVADVLDKFEAKIGKMIDKVDDMAGKLDFGNPLHIVAYGAIMEVKQVLVDFKDDISQL